MALSCNTLLVGVGESCTPTASGTTGRVAILPLSFLSTPATVETDPANGQMTANAFLLAAGKFALKAELNPKKYTGALSTPQISSYGDKTYIHRIPFAISNATPEAFGFVQQVGGEPTLAIVERKDGTYRAYGVVNGMIWQADGDTETWENADGIQLTASIASDPDAAEKAVSYATSLTKTTFEALFSA